MGTYQYFRENCALCGDSLPMRDMNKLYKGESHHSCPTPRKLCSVCDNCFPKLLDFLEVPEPEEPERRPYPRPQNRQWCQKCVTYVNKTAKFCPYCGEELATQKEK